MPEFDPHAEDYRASVQASISFSGQELEFFTRRKADRLVEVAARLLGDPLGLRVLDVGCGVGATDAFLAGRFGSLVGLDESPESVVRAAKTNRDTAYTVADGARLPFTTASFDLAFAICVVHHLALESREQFGAELRRVVRPGGLVVIFEHNALNPLTRLAVSRCAFDADAHLVTRRGTRRLLTDAGLRTEEACDIIFSTFDRPWALKLDRRLARVPLGAQHYVAARR
jgi:SAM-dependent methyltransferase